MELIVDIVYSNLLSPMILFFVMGILAVIVNSDLKVPEAFYSGYTMIILFTIGIKGGTELRDINFWTMILPIIASIFLSLIMLAIAYFTINKVYKFSETDSLATAAHYGSVSAVTFIAGLGFLEKIKVPYESYISAILVVMEGPAIIAAIVLFNLGNREKGKKVKANLKFAIKDAFFGKSIFLLIGGIFIGLVAHKDGLVKIQPLFGDLFYGLLCIFLLHIGMVATQQLKKIEGFKIRSFTFAFILPVIGGVMGVLVGSLIGMSVGGTFMLGVLTASSSYIAAPAAIGHAIPKANSGIYLGASLGLTLPFNLIFGIPLYYWLSTLM